MLKIYNTLSKKVEEFVPINPLNVGMYICGPTVYDYFHIGNARTFIMADMIRKYLEYKGYSVNYIMNLTDIDDKIINKSNEEKTAATIVAKKYSDAFLEDIERLGIKPATNYPKATENISEILAMIKNLIDSGSAYNVDGNVFYSVSSFREYGKLSGKKIEDLESGARVEVMEEKRNPLDFALWKKSKPAEPFWKSDWGDGRPGWHIECSAMSCKHLGETFDIHAGGNDLIFPHHENEIAQSEAANNKKFVNYWLHFGFLNINKEKMSKSLGNFFTAREVLAKYSAEAIRLFFSQAHYRGPVDFTEDLLESAEKGLDKLRNIQSTIKSALNRNKSGGITPEFDFQNFERRFSDALDDDFNSPQAVAVIFDFVREVNKTIAENESININFYIEVRNLLVKTADSVLGIMSFEEKESKQDSLLENKLIQYLIDLRLKAKIENNFQLADEIRIKLDSLGIVLKDTKEGTDFIKRQ